MRMARRRALHLTDKAGTPEDRRIAQHCQKIFMARLHHDKVSDLIRKRHMKKAQAVAQAQAQSQAQAHKAPAVEAPAAKHAVTQAKRLTKGKAPPKTAWWKNKHFGFNKVGLSCALLLVSILALLSLSSLPTSRFLPPLPSLPSPPSPPSLSPSPPSRLESES
jgi:ribosomal protein L12E/L44/L45/RPP1/RPP2